MGHSPESLGAPGNPAVTETTAGPIPSFEAPPPTETDPFSHTDPFDELDARAHGRPEMRGGGGLGKLLITKLSDALAAIGKTEGTRGDVFGGADEIVFQSNQRNQARLEANKIKEAEKRRNAALKAAATRRKKATAKGVGGVTPQAEDPFTHKRKKHASPPAEITHYNDD